MEQRFLPNMSPGIFRVANAARTNPDRPLLALAHPIDVDALRRAYFGLRKDAAVGVDKITKEQYGENLEENLRDLHQRLKSMQYRHQPILRVHIEKDGGKQRPIGISTTEDKIVQDSLRELLEVIYEPMFKSFSYGFRPGRKAHDALSALDKSVHSGKVHWILEADIVSFFDRMDRKLLKELLEKRLADKSLMRLIGKCLHVGVLDGETKISPELGTAQGSTLSPLLANIYLHYALDEWFDDVVKPRMKGQAILIRYCDDFVMGFEFEEDAKRVMKALTQRLAKYGLELHPEKTRLLDFRRPARNPSIRKGPGTFEFLGFLIYWKRSRRSGGWYMAMRTKRARLIRVKKRIDDGCRKNRHLRVKDQHAALEKRIQGHFNYFGLRGNGQSLNLVIYWAKRSWHKWLNRRSQRSRMTWKRFAALLRDFPLPKATPKLSLWVNS